MTAPFRMKHVEHTSLEALDLTEEEQARVCAGLDQAAEESRADHANELAE